MTPASPRRAGRPSGPQPAAACRRDHRLPRRRSPRLDDLLLPVAGVDRQRHRKAGVVGHHRRSRGLDGTGDRSRQACRQCRRGGRIDDAYRRGCRRIGASRRIPSARRSRTRCGPSDSDEWHHRPAKATGDQVARAGANGVQCDQRGDRSAGCTTGVRLLAVRRHRGMPAGRGSSQRQAHRDAGAIHCRRVCARDKDAWHQAIRCAAGRLPHAARRRRPQGRPGVARFPDQRVGAVGPRDSRRVREALRHPGPISLRCNGIRWLTLCVDTRPRGRVR